MSVLSPLARGYGSWAGPSYDPYNEKVDEVHKFFYFSYKMCQAKFMLIY